MKKLSNRILKLIFGLFLFSIGIVFSIQANIGLAPWEAFSIGLSSVTGVTYGNVVILTGVAILCIVAILKEKIGLGTILNTILIGAMSDILIKLNVIPMMNNFLGGLLMLLLGQVIICIGSYFYIGQGLGSGPRDSLMIAISKRFVKMPIGAIRGGIEGTVLLIGWMLGAKVGLGTILAVFGISFILQFTFKILDFNVKSVEHESLIDSVRLLKNM